MTAMDDFELIGDGIPEDFCLSIEENSALQLTEPQNARNKDHNHRHPRTQAVLTASLLLLAACGQSGPDRPIDVRPTPTIGQQRPTPTNTPTPLPLFPFSINGVSPTPYPEGDYKIFMEPPVKTPYDVYVQSVEIAENVTSEDGRTPIITSHEATEIIEAKGIDIGTILGGGLVILKYPGKEPIVVVREAHPSMKGMISPGRLNRFGYREIFDLENDPNFDPKLVTAETFYIRYFDTGFVLRNFPRIKYRMPINRHTNLYIFGYNLEIVFPEDSGREPSVMPGHFSNPILAKLDYLNLWWIVHVMDNEAQFGVPHNALMSHYRFGARQPITRKDMQNFYKDFYRYIPDSGELWIEPNYENQFPPDEYPFYEIDPPSDPLSKQEVSVKTT